MASNFTSTDSKENTFRSSFSNVNDDFLDDLLICGICLCRMSSPCCLPCAHSFCRLCLINYARNNNTNSNNTMNFILCPYCKYQLNFRSIEDFEATLVINPVLKQLCDALDQSKLNTDHNRQDTSSNRNVYRARCHTCCLLKMLKICKHCAFMICDTCRQAHLLEVHQESKLNLESLKSRLEIISEKRLEMQKFEMEFDDIRQNIDDYTQRLVNHIEKQRDEAFQIIDHQTALNKEEFWSMNGFENKEKFDYFLSLAQSAETKLSATNITDKVLVELFNDLQTIPTIDEKSVESIEFTNLRLELNETVFNNRIIQVLPRQKTTDHSNDSIDSDVEQQDDVHS